MNQPALNLHSHPEAQRRDRILDAAERAFARQGFHAATMQHVAAEARMSAGNLYRTFPSKDVLVSGLTERDRASMAQDFQALACAPDLLAGIGAMLLKHLSEEPVWRTQLIVEIWAEAARNPSIALMCGSIDTEVKLHLTALIAGAQALHPALRGGDPRMVVQVMELTVAGLFKARATDPSFEGRPAVALAIGIFRAALTGALQPDPLFLSAPEG
jgi:TetR/AcrR family transcriptional repressor of uid operon